jgi:uroporphyrinogen-III synthase
VTHLGPKQVMGECGASAETLRTWVTLRKRFFCVGPQTADKLREAFQAAPNDGSVLACRYALLPHFVVTTYIHPCRPSTFMADTGNLLAEVIVKEMGSLDHDRLPLLYLCGNIRRSELPTSLKQVR